jgi:hypothetical protein
MARQMFTGNYGAPLAQVDTRPILAAGQAWGQAFQNLGQVASDVLEKHRQKKEKQKQQQDVEDLVSRIPNLLSTLGASNQEEEDALKKLLSQRPEYLDIAFKGAQFTQQQDDRRRLLEQEKQQRAQQDFTALAQRVGTMIGQSEENKPLPSALLQKVSNSAIAAGVDPQVGFANIQALANQVRSGITQSRLDESRKKAATELAEVQTSTMQESLDKAKFDKGVQKLILMKPVELRNPFAFDAGDATPEQIAAARQKVKEMDTKLAAMTNDARIKRRKEISEQFDIAFKKPTIKLRQPHKEMGSTVSVEDYEKLNAKDSRKYPLDAEAYIVARNRVDELLVEQETLNRSTMVNVNIPDNSEDSEEKPEETLLPYQIYEKEQKAKKREKFLKAMSDFPEDYQTYGEGM